VVAAVGGGSQIATSERARGGCAAASIASRAGASWSVRFGARAPTTARIQAPARTPSGSADRGTKGRRRARSTRPSPGTAGGPAVGGGGGGERVIAERERPPSLRQGTDVVHLGAQVERGERVQRGGADGGIWVPERVERGSEDRRGVGRREGGERRNPDARY